VVAALDGFSPEEAI